MKYMLTLVESTDQAQSLREKGGVVVQDFGEGICAAFLPMDSLGVMEQSSTILRLEANKPATLHNDTSAVIIGVVVTLIGIAIIGIAGAMKSAALPEEEKKKAVKDFNFGKGITVALLAGFMSACFNIGLNFGQDLYLEGTRPIFQTLPATMLVTFGGFLTNAAYCLFQNAKNKTWGDYRQKSLWANNILFCCLAGLLWYSQFFGLSLGKGFLTGYPVLITFSWCILMSLNVVFSNVWGIILKEWKGVSRKTVAVLLLGIVVLIISTFLPQLL
jgi:L-rhamnose-H+ transport protein